LRKWVTGVSFLRDPNYVSSARNLSARLAVASAAPAA